MRLLIDECIDERLRHEFIDHDCQTACFAGLAGLKKRYLLDAAERAGFEGLVTNRLADLRRVVPAAIDALRSIRAGEVLRIS